MGRTWAIIEREMRRFRRSPVLIAMSMVMPIVQLVVLGYAFGGNVQAVSYFPNSIAARLGLAFKATKAEIDKAAHQVATFSIAGVRAVAKTTR